jgi:repressor of nif and glnA expression
MFIAGKMTNVIQAIGKGEGKILASFQEIPMLSISAAEAVIEKLKGVNLCNLVLVGKVSEPICEMPVRLNKVGLVLPSGLNSVAAAAEAGIEVTNKAMSGVIHVEKLRSFWSL